MDEVKSKETPNFSLSDPGAKEFMEAINELRADWGKSAQTVSKVARQQLSLLAETLLDPNDDLPALKKLATSLASAPELRKNLAFLIRDFCAEHLRPEVRRFAGLMEMKLMKHDPARGMSWKDGSASPPDIISHIHDLMGELETAVNNNQRVGLKAADVANHVMILADLAGELGSV